MYLMPHWRDKSTTLMPAASIDWRAEDTQEEYVIMDKAGRVQIPRELLNTLDLKDNKLKLEMQGDRIIISKPGA